MMSSKRRILLQSSVLPLALLAHPAFAQAPSPNAATGPAGASPIQGPATATPKSSDSMPEIIVTARRVEERLQDVPISITVFNQQQIDNRNILSATDLATYTPSLSANNNYGPDNTSFAIRGFVQDAGTQPSVGTYFADVVALRGPPQGTQAGDTAGPGDFFDLQNVQVLKGPQGTLQGRNTTGGAVLFVPQKPTSRTEGYLETSFGNYDMHRVQGAFNAPLNDKARFRIAIDHDDSDGWLHNTSGIGPSDLNNVDYTAGRASLVVDILPNLENYTIASYSHSANNGTVQKLIGCNDTGANATSLATAVPNLGNFLGLLSCGQLAREKAAHAGFDDVEQAFPNPTSEIDQWQLINTTTWRASDNLTIKNIASYGQFIDKLRTALFGTNFQVTDLPALYQPLFFRGVPPIFTDINADLNSADQYTFTEEMQAQGSFLDDRLSYQSGVYLETSGPLGSVGSLSNQTLACSNISGGVCSDPIGSTFSAVYSAALGAPLSIPVGALNYTQGRETFHDVGIYSQINYKITDQLTFTTGARYTWDTTTDNSTRYYYNYPVQPPYTQARTKSCTDPGQAPSCSEFLKESSRKPTWLFDLDYKPAPDTLLYAKYARGYRAGGVSPNGPIDYRTFAPEQVENYEVGLKQAFHRFVRGTFDIDGFYNNFTNQQLQLGFNTNPDYMGTGAPAPVSPTTAIVNAGKSQIWGVEVESTITPFQGFTIDGAYTYLNAKILSIESLSTVDPNYVAAQASIVPGSPLVLSPENKYSITGTYTLPLDRSLGRIAFGATYTHTDKQLTNYVYQTAAAVALFGANFGSIGATDLVNLNLNWTSVLDKPVDLSFYATNVTNENYYTFIAGLGGLTGAGNEFASVGAPRMYGLRLRYHFGS